MNDYTLSGSVTLRTTAKKATKKNVFITIVLLLTLYFIMLASVTLKTQVYIAQYRLTDQLKKHEAVLREKRNLEYQYSILTSIPNLKKWAEERGLRPPNEGEFFVLRDDDE